MMKNSWKKVVFFRRGAWESWESWRIGWRRTSHGAQSARGLAQSKTLREVRGRPGSRAGGRRCGWKPCSRPPMILWWRPSKDWPSRVRICQRTTRSTTVITSAANRKNGPGLCRHVLFPRLAGFAGSVSRTGGGVDRRQTFRAGRIRRTFEMTRGHGNSWWNGWRRTFLGSQSARGLAQSKTRREVWGRAGSRAVETARSRS